MGSYYKEEWLGESLDSKDAIVMKVIMMMRVIMKMMISSSYQMVLPIVATK